MNIINKLKNRLRAKYYSIYYNIGKNCSFHKIIFWDCDYKSVHIGDNVLIFRNTEICSKKDNNVKIGKNTFINQRTIIRPGTIIGQRVDIGPNVMFITDSHEIGDNNKRAGRPITKEIIVGDGCWIGAGSTILGGVTIEEGVIIAAGSLVNKNCKANSLYAGVPAKFIKRLD